MSKKTRILVIAMSLAAILTLTIGGIAMASGPNSNATCDGTGQGNGIGLGGTSICTDNVSSLLGLTTEEIQDMRQDGMSLVQIAATQNVTEEQLTNTIIAARQAWVEARVADGTLTQERATFMLQNMEQNIVKAINRTTTGKPEWAGQNGNNGNGQLKQQARGNCANGYGEPNDGTGPGKMNKWGRGNGK
jgi:hypothetical protein